MPSYTDKTRQDLAQIQPKKQEASSATDDNLSSALIQLLQNVYGIDKIQTAVKIEDETFLAGQSKMVFDFVLAPEFIKNQRIAVALKNHYNIEIVYFVADNAVFKHSQISFRYIGDYVDVLKSKSRSDLVRWINHHRNKFEENYVRKKA